MDFFGPAPDMGATEYTVACSDPVYTAAATCVGGNNSQFFIDVSLTSGSGTNYTISNSANGSTWSIAVGSTVQVGPFSNNSQVDITVTDDDSPSCTVTTGSYYHNCNGSCGPLVTANEICLSSDGSNFYVNVTVSAGGNSSFTISNSVNGSTTQIDLGATEQVGPFPNGVVMSITVTDDNNGSCSTTVSNLTEDCPCVSPFVTETAVCNAGNTDDFFIDVTVNTGSGASYLVTNSYNAQAIVLTVGGTGQLGPFPNNTSVDVTTTDTGNGSCAVTEFGVTTACNTVTISAQVSSSNADVEEDGGEMELESGDLDMDDGKIVGLWFDNINVPQGATITNAEVQFVADKTTTDPDPSEIEIYADDSDNAPIFTAAADDLSDRPTTSAKVDWNPPPWVKDQALPAEKTPNLAAIIQELVDRPGWGAQSVAIIFEGSSGKREGRSWDDTPSDAAVLTITYTPPFNPLPVEMSDFSTQVDNCEDIVLDWVTLTETNNDYFEIQRSQDGVNFSTISRVDGQGNSLTKTTYQYLDKGLAKGNYYYRLVQMDLDGRSSFSQILFIEKNCTIELFEVFPNPTKEVVNLNVKLPVGSESELDIFDQSGQLIQSIALSEEFNDGIISKQLQIGHFPAGAYSFVLKVNGKKVYTERLLKQ